MDSEERWKQKEQSKAETDAATVRYFFLPECNKSKGLARVGKSPHICCPGLHTECSTVSKNHTQCSSLRPNMATGLWNGQHRKSLKGWHENPQVGQSQESWMHPTWIYHPSLSTERTGDTFTSSLDFLDLSSSFLVFFNASVPTTERMFLNLEKKSWCWI